MTKLDQRLFPNTGASTGQETERTSVLAIGNLTQWLETCAQLPDNRHLAFANIEEITEATLAVLEPRVILSPVVASNFDCMDVATILARLEFKGAYLAVSHRLPNPDIVRREVRTLCPDLDFDILSVDDDGQLCAWSTTFP